MVETNMTVLRDGERVSKASDRIEALGTIDELSSWISKSTMSVHFKDLIIDTLIDIMSVIADPTINYSRIIKRATIMKATAEAFKSTVVIPESFAKYYQVCDSEVSIIRTVCRRAERRVVKIHADLHRYQDLRKKSLEGSIEYLNSLSSFLYYYSLIEKKVLHIDGTVL